MPVRKRYEVVRCPTRGLRYPSKICIEGIEGLGLEGIKVGDHVWLVYAFRKPARGPYIIVRPQAGEWCWSDSTPQLWSEYMLPDGWAYDQIGHRKEAYSWLEVEA